MSPPAPAPQPRPRNRRPSRAAAQILLAAAVGVTLVGAGAPTPALAQDADRPVAMADPASVAADAALAERVAQWARAGVTVENPSPALLRQSAALAEAAGRLDPGDREHPRLLADLELLAGDRDAALAALSALRRIDPGNETAGIQTIDLAANSIQTADGKVDYLTRIVDAGDALPAAVRSHAALLAGRARFDQGRDQESADLLDRALELNPVNVPALRARADRALSDPATAAPERVAVLLKLLEADPAQPAVIAAVADVLASVGLPAEAVEQYERAAKLGGAVGQPPSPNDYLNYAVQLMASGQARSAAEVGQALSQQSPGDPAPAMLALAATRQLGGEEAVTTGAEALRASLVEQLAELSSQAGGAGGPTPDYAADANRLAGGGSPDVASAYAAALVDLGWVDTFFLNRPAEPGVLDAAETLLGTQSPAVARLRGWSYLADGRTGEARVKLEAVADRDPLSAMGLILARAQEPSPDAADLSRRASDLVAGHRTGLVSALLRSGLRDFSPSPAPADDANAVRQAVAGFPRPLLDALDRGEPVRDLYQVTVERGKVAHAFGEPVTVDVTVRNTSPRPIALGDGGLVRSVVVADASVKGYDPQTFGAVAVERVRRAVVLPPGGQTSERVRVDQGPLRQYLLNAPGANVPIYVSVLTNAAFVRQGEGEEAREGYAVGPLGLPVAGVGHGADGQPAERAAGGAGGGPPAPAGAGRRAGPGGGAADGLPARVRQTGGADRRGAAGGGAVFRRPEQRRRDRPVAGGAGVRQVPDGQLRRPGGGRAVADRFGRLARPTAGRVRVGRPAAGRAAGRAAAARRRRRRRDGAEARRRDDRRRAGAAGGANRGAGGRADPVTPRPSPTSATMPPCPPLTASASPATSSGSSSAASRPCCRRSSRCR